MPLSRPAPVRGSSPPGGGKRRRGRPKGSRGRKRQKRLDSIRDTPGALHSRPQSPENDGTVIRRSSRVRRAPAFLDSSPAPPRRRKKRKIEGSPGPTGSGARGGRRGRNSERRGNRGQEEGDSGPLRAEDATSGSPLQETKDSKDEVEDWRSRLRSRIGERKGRSSSFGGGAARKENESLKKVSSETGSGSQTIGSSRRGRRRVLSYEVNANIEETKCQIEFLPSSDQEESGERAPQEEDLKIVTDSLVYPNEEIEPSLPSEEVKENVNFTGAAEVENLEQFEEETKIPDQQLGDNKQENEAIIMNGHLDGKPFENEDVVKEDNLKASVADKKLGRKHIKEGRRCGLCGGGAGGRPPKRLAHESSGSDNEAYEGSSASEEPNYDIWDGFGDEPEWLGRLLGPIIDRFGIPRVWVHQHCAVWSPEVYFAGLGCLKNVRAALCRGRALKCSRCGRPGATIGCRVDRCPKTYHLPCSRADGCIFDHRKFLIACHEHRHLFQPLGNDRAQHVKIMKFKKLKFDMRRLSHDAWRRDLEAEEKWLENCGEDEEFLKREGRRLQRDLFRIAPVYIGGSENEKLFQGWESVAGLQDVINCMKEVVILPLLYPEIFNTLGLTPPRGVLLHGHPGTGKTLVVRALIGACSRGDKRIAYFARKGADCLGKYVGDAERQLRLLFQVAERCQPSIIFFDEIDGLAPCRSRNQDQTHNSVVSTLLSLLDGLKSRGSVIVIGATNRPDAVDPALRRPGRFDREIYFPLPKLNDRSAILSLHTRNWPNPVSGPLLSWIANNTAGYAGADLQALCTQAAMNALKRSCALEELLSSAEKLSDYGKLPSLPSFTVEERDWLVALAAAPPPCSRREAGIAANDIVSSPLHSHLIACLLKPLSELLISFYMDERIWLPPALVKASELIKSVISTALEQEKVSTGLWRSHLHSLINQPSIAKEIEKILCRYGLVTGRSGCDQSYILDKDNNDCKDLDADRSKPAYFETPSKSKLKSVEFGKSTGFHVLVAGTPRSGQQHLASSLLHGFSGHLEIQNVNLATMSLEGHGDIVRGLTQTLLKCLNGGRCMVFMPRIDLWAIETVRKEAEPTDTYQDTHTMSSVSEVDMTRIASEAWNLFIEQVESGTAASSLIIMATCEMQTHDLPLGIRKFFTNDVREDGGSIPSRHSVPRFSVNVDGNFSHDVLISSCASKLSEDLVQNYVQLMHHYSHMDYRHDGIQTFQTMETSSEPGHAILPTVKQMDPEQVAATGEASWIHNQKQQHAVTDPVIARGNVNIDVQHNRHEASIPKTLSKNVKGGSLLAIATFGYQILRSPHFAELCWVTSKLKEGPYADVNGTRKHWPFSSCLVNTCSSPEKVVFSGLNNNNKDTELSGSVRGLMAVGLLAYRGTYASVQEVSSEVRKVLELLVGKIRLRISAGKDAFRYFRILSQVAYLEDIVNSWAYNFRSLPAETCRTTPNTNPRSLGDEPVDIEPNESPILKIKSRMPVDSNCNEQVTLIKGDPHKFSNDLEGFISQPLSSPNHCVLEKGEPFPLAPPSDLHSSSAAWTALPSANGTNGSEGSIVKNLDAKVQLSSTESSRYFLLDTCDVYNQDKETTACSTSVVEPCNGSENLISSCTAAIVTGELDSTANLANTGSSRLSKELDVWCLYCCCCSCLPDLYVLLRRILSDSWRSSGHCSTIDDLHDILASRSVNILATVRRCFYLPNSSANRQHLQSEQSDSFQCDRCACQIDIFQQFQKMNGECTFDKIGFLPAECFSHLSNKSEAETANFETGSVAPVLKFFFKDGVLMPTDPQTGIQFHCRFEKICLSAVVQMILVNEQQFD